MARKKATDIAWQFGNLSQPSAYWDEQEISFKERNGYAQVERVMAGLETAPSPQRMRADRMRAERSAANLVTVGTRQVDMHAYEKVTGKATYPVDVYPSEVLYTRVVRSPHPHAKVKSIDISKAEKHPGVVAILTPNDVPAFRPPLAHPILTMEPSYQGEPIVAIAAVDEGAAEDALKLVQIEYEQLPYVLDARDALKQGAPLVRTGLRDNNVREPFTYRRGDIARGFSEADVTVENTTMTAWEQHVAMEPHAAIALWEKDKLTVWTSSQYVHAQRNTLAAALNMPQSKVRFISEFAGGGFGDKTRIYPYHAVAALLAKKTGKPVRYELTRKDVFLECGHNYPKYQELKLGFKRDGTLVALQSKSWIANGAWGASANTDDVESALRLYKVANVDVIGYSPRTNQVLASPLRSVGEPAGVFALEILMDAAAEKLDMDPLELRLKNIEERVDQVTNLPYSSNGIRETLIKGAEAFGWKQKWQGWKKQRDLTKPQKGVGVAAFACNKGGKSPPMTAICQLDRDGSVRIVQAAADIGPGQRTTFAMIAAEVLGVELSTITVTKSDTETTSDTGIIAGSRGTKSVGSAVEAAARDAREQLLLGASRRMEVSPNDLDIEKGVIFVKSDPSKRMTITDAVAAGVVVIDSQVFPSGAPIIGRGVVPAPSGYSQKTFGAGFYEVETDPGTGQVKVLKIVQAHDIGKAINPLAVENQIYGGAIQGMGKALTEELIYDPSTGIIVNPNLDDYKLHMMETVPEVVPILVEPIDVLGPFGAKGIGEPANLLACPAIANAITDAVGVRLTQLPMTPYRVMKALRSV